MKVKLRKLDAFGKAVKENGEDVFIEVDSIAADNISKSKFWEVVNDPRDSQGPAKPSRKSEKAENKSDKSEDEPIGGDSDLITE